MEPYVEVTLRFFDPEKGDRPTSERTLTLVNFELNEHRPVERETIVSRSGERIVGGFRPTGEHTLQIEGDVVE